MSRPSLTLVTGAIAAIAAAGLGLLALPLAGAVAAPAASQEPAVMILLDTNNGLQVGTFFDAERTAALRYARALPAGVAAGLITFSNHWHLALAPTTERSQLKAALNAAGPTGGATSRGIDRAITAADAQLASIGATTGDRLLVLSNGEDIKKSLRGGKVPIDTLTWAMDPDDNARAIRSLAAATSGHVGDLAKPAGLAALINPVAKPSPSPVAHSSAPQPTDTSNAAVKAAPSVPIGLAAGLFVTIFVLALLNAGALRQGDQRRRTLEHLEQYSSRTRRPAAEAAEGKAVAAVLSVAGRVLRSSNSEPRLAAKLDVAGISRKPAEWVIIGTSGTLVLIAALSLLTRNVLLAVLIGGLAGWAVMHLLLSIRISRRRAAFADQLPDVLQLVAGSLQSGFSLPQALDSVAREDTQPSSSEISRAIAEARIGIDIEVALGAVAERMDSNDMRWTVMAIRIQREVGGNLAEVLRNTVSTMRERAYLRRQVRTLSGEGRLSAFILGAIPILVGAWLFYSSPTYMRPLYTTVYGVAMLVGAAVLFVLGVLWMRILIKVEV